MSRVARSIGLVVGIALFTVVGYVNAALEWLARIIVTVSKICSPQRLSVKSELPELLYFALFRGSTLLWVLKYGRTGSNGTRKGSKMFLSILRLTKKWSTSQKAFN